MTNMAVSQKDALLIEICDSERTSPVVHACRYQIVVSVILKEKHRMLLVINLAVIRCKSAMTVFEVLVQG